MTSRILTEDEMKTKAESFRVRRVAGPRMAWFVEADAPWPDDGGVHPQCFFEAMRELLAQADAEPPLSPTMAAVLEPDQ